MKTALFWKKRTTEEQSSELGENSISLKSELFEWLETIAIALVAVVLLFTFVFRIVGVDGDSMMDTLL